MAKHFWYSLLLLMGIGLILLGSVALVVYYWTGPSELSPFMYIAIGATALFCVLFFFGAHRAEVPGHLGGSTGPERGPKPGDGAVIHHSSGEADFDGAPDQMPPPQKHSERDLPYPPERSSD